jgi:hypothetical protein
MIDQLISTFCRLDDFCIIHEKQLQSKAISYKTFKRGPKQSLSLSEIMTILVIIKSSNIVISKVFTMIFYVNTGVVSFLIYQAIQGLLNLSFQL